MMHLTRRMGIAGLGTLLLISITWAADSQNNPANPCTTNSADETKPDGPLLLCRILLLQINSPDARLPIPPKDEATNPSLKSVDTPVTVLVDPAIHPMNFGAILAEKDTHGIMIDLLKYNGITYNPKHMKDNKAPEWKVLTHPMFLTRPNVEANMTIGDDTPTMIIQPDGTIDKFSHPTGIKFVISPGQIVDNILQIKSFSITHTYVTNTLIPETLIKKPYPFPYASAVISDFNVKLSMVMPLNTCAVFQLPFAPKDHPVFAFLGVSVLAESEKNPSSQPSRVQQSNTK